VAEETRRASLREEAAFQLANVTKTPPQFGAITPRWLVRLLDWKPLESGTLRVNKVDEGKAIESICEHADESPLVSTYVEYLDKPREYRLSSELINNAEYGLLHNVAASQKLKTRKGPPTPDDLDELLTKVWKEPSLFLAHPRAIAAFGRECTRRGVPPPTVTLFGTPFLTWRGIPLVPSDKIAVRSKDQTSKILLLRVGEKKQGVVGLFQPGLPGEQSPGLSVRFMGIDERALASYLVSLYCSAAVLTDDAIALLEDVAVGHYHEYL